MKWILIGTLALMMASPALAQEQGTWEFGSDAGFDLDTADGATRFALALPGASWRVGHFVSPSISIEVPFSFQFVDVEGYSVHAIRTGLGVLYNTDSWMFVRGNVAITHLGDDDDSAMQTGFGFALGVRQRAFADNIRFRISGGYARFLENEDDWLPAYNNFSVAFGFSILN